MGTVGVALAQLAVTVVLLALNVRFAVGQLGMRFQFRGFDFSLLKAIAAFSAWIFANQICELANQNLPEQFFWVLYRGASGGRYFCGSSAGQIIVLLVVDDYVECLYSSH